MKDYYQEYPDEHGQWRDPDAESHHNPNLDSFFHEMDQKYDRDTEIIIEKSQVNIRPLIYAIFAIVFVIILLLIFSNTMDTPSSHPAKNAAPKEIFGEAVTPIQPPAEDSDVIGRAIQSLVFILVTDQTGRVSSGSGFIIDNSGTILTNHHVVNSAARIVVWGINGKSSTASLERYHANLDIATIRVSQSLGVPPIKLGNSSQVKLGATVLVLGYPSADVLGSEPTITSGILSSIRPAENPEWFQIDAAVNPGNSGGPLIRKDTGEVIGIVTSKLQQAEGISFARPINRSLDLIR